MDLDDEAKAPRDEALARVLEYRVRGRSRPASVRVALAALGSALLIVSIPLGVVLPEVGIPALLVALRLLAVEADWAAHTYAWLDWRFTEARAWFHRQSGSVRMMIVAALIAVAVALVWVLFHEFA